jgi:hypothetical protein
MIKYLKLLFTEHPQEAGETYFSHQRFAMGTGLVLLFLAVSLSIHAILPFIFKDTASKGIHGLSDKLKARDRFRDDWW